MWCNREDDNNDINHNQRDDSDDDNDDIDHNQRDDNDEDIDIDHNQRDDNDNDNDIDTDHNQCDINSDHEQCDAVTTICKNDNDEQWLTWHAADAECRTRSCTSPSEDNKQHHNKYAIPNKQRWRKTNWE